MDNALRRDFIVTMMRDEATLPITDFAHAANLKFVRRGSEQETQEYIKQRLVGVSEWALTAPAIIAAHALHSSPLLLEGEPGAGKRFVARLVHDCGVRAHRPFVVIDAESIHESVLQSILFEAPASLPPAARTLQSEFAEQAKGGTIYVADVSTLSSDFRHRVVRSAEHPELEHARKHSLQEKNIRLVFGSCGRIAPEEGDVRSRGRVPGVVRIPALRDRADDVGLLAEYFAMKACHRMGKEPRVLSPAALATLSESTWPANVGELKCVVELMVRRSGPPVLDASLLPPHMVDRSAAAEPGDPLRDGINLHDEVQRYEKSLLSAALERCGGIQTRAARLLGMKVSTLNSKLANYNIDASSFKTRRSA